MERRTLALGITSIVLAWTPALPLAVVLAVATIGVARPRPPSSLRTATLWLCSAALVCSVVLLPLYLMFLEHAGLWGR